MSIKASEAVWKHATGTPTQRHILIAIADNADEHGVAWPSIGKPKKPAELMKKTGAPRRTIQRAIRACIDRGELARVSVGEGRGHAPYYVIRLPGLDGDMGGAIQRRGVLPASIPKWALEGRQDGTERATLSPEKGDILTTKGRHSGTRTVREPSIEASENRKNSFALSGDLKQHLPLPSPNGNNGHVGGEGDEGRNGPGNRPDAPESSNGSQPPLLAAVASENQGPGEAELEAEIGALVEELGEDEAMWQGRTEEERRAVLARLERKASRNKARAL